MKTLLALTLFLLSMNAFSQTSNDPQINFKEVASLVGSKQLESLPTHDQGRLKPLHTLARETSLFITGKYSFLKLEPIQFYLAIIVAPDVERLELINIRHPKLRKRLGLDKEQRYFSLTQIERTPLMDWAQPLIEKQEQNARSIEPEEKNVLEIYSQYWFVKRIRSGSHFLNAINFSSLIKDEPSTAAHSKSNPAIDAGRQFLSSLVTQDINHLSAATTQLIASVRNQKVPELFRPQLDNMDIEVFYNKAHLFLISAILFLLLGCCLFVESIRHRIVKRPLAYLFALPFFPLILGFAIRVYVTGFAPVTNMYGTMVWVSFGIALFSLILLFLYKNHLVVSALWLSSAVFLFLTESIPLILSPNMDPLVAVLRSNLWLTIHVLTIVISYAAFSITMVLGNIVLIRSLIKKSYNDQFVKEYSQSIYRMIQLGVFLLSVGIILGGVWADYSWGRFWGWDPKETWALIADIGYLAILHARFIGWLKPFGIAAASTLAYLLVIMAWYGVNFILAAGLHSYGFSSGGATLVLTFTVIQLTLVGAALVNKFINQKRVQNNAI